MLVFLCFTNFKQAGKKSSNSIEIRFGKGGGITGLYEKYTLSKNGVLWKYSNYDSTKILIKTISKTKHNYIIKKISNKTLQSINLNESGNMNSYIELSKGLKVFKRFQWPIEKMDIPVQIKELDSLLNTLL
jgi:ABC-type tungstate transport system permease subunit